MCAQFRLSVAVALLSVSVVFAQNVADETKTIQKAHSWGARRNKNEFQRAFELIFPPATKRLD